MTTPAPGSIEEIRDFVRAHERIIVRGAATKQVLSAKPPEAADLDIRGLSGILEYDPGEFTFTALAGTPLREIDEALRENGQHLPFDPPLMEAGATIGGALASGLNGPGRLRYGGLRDFVLGVKIVDGEGRILQGGGKVVKNAAGFDLPKLMTGSMGRLGVIVAATFKVFPRPREWRTIRIACSGLEDALETMLKLYRLPLDLEALDLEPPGKLLVRISGEGASLIAHAEKIASLTGHSREHLTGEDDAAVWRAQREFTWSGNDDLLVKIALTPRRIPTLEEANGTVPLVAPRRYSVAGNVAWISWPRDRSLAELRIGPLSGLVVRGPASAENSPRVGSPPEAALAFGSRIKSVLDPANRFPPLI